MPFASFGLPFFSPRRWDVLVVGLVLVVLLASRWAAGDAVATLVKILGVVPGVLVGLTMASRVTGIGTWAGLAAGLAGAALVPGDGRALDAASTAALFAALGTGAAAWTRIRDEITYARRVDVLSGLAVVVLVLLAVGLSALLGRLTWANAAAFVGGGLVATFYPRSWEPPLPPSTTGPITAT